MAHLRCTLTEIVIKSTGSFLRTKSLLMIIQAPPRVGACNGRGGPLEARSLCLYSFLTMPLRLKDNTRFSYFSNAITRKLWHGGAKPPWSYESPLKSPHPLRYTPVTLFPRAVVYRYLRHACLPPGCLASVTPTPVVSPGSWIPPNRLSLCAV